MRFNVFLERPGIQDLSVDRLDRASVEEATGLGERAATRRQQTFYGWGVVSAERAVDNGRSVAATPRPDNPFHADIVLPDRAVSKREEQKVHAQQLADLSSWRASPTV